MGFRNHSGSLFHKEAYGQLFTLPATTRNIRNIGELLSTQHAIEKAQNRHCLLKILSVLRFLSRQGCAIRGSGDEVDGNFHQLLKFQSNKDPKVCN